jgi:hypothetical protein
VACAGASFGSAKILIANKREIVTDAESNAASEASGKGAKAPEASRPTGRRVSGISWEVVSVIHTQSCRPHCFAWQSLGAMRTPGVHWASATG